MIWPLAAGIARLLPAEAAHRAAVLALKTGLHPLARPPALPVSILGQDFANPLGLAAGFDKDGEAMAGELAIGFGHLEVGTITPLAQPGNPRPRVFRLPASQAVINRYGFNSSGIDRVRPRIAAFRAARPAAALGINIGANKDSRDRIADYRAGAAAFAGLASWLTINISSPNTPGLRDLQEAASARAILQGVQAAIAEQGGSCPVLVKLAPDMQPAAMLATIDACMEEGCAGFVLTNSTLSRPSSLRGSALHQVGGLSGKPLAGLATEQLALAASHLNGATCLFGVGGIASPADAYARLLLGANLLQLYTALALTGPQLPGRILEGLARMMAEDGVARPDELTGQFSDAVAALRHAEDLWHRC